MWIYRYKILFSIFTISYISSITAMEDEMNYFLLQKENPVSIKLESTELPTHGTVVVPEFTLPISPELIAYKQAPSHPTRIRKPTTLQFYANFVCAEAENEQESVISEDFVDEDKEFSEGIPQQKRNRIILKKEINDSDKVFTCHICSKTYNTPWYLKRHLISHNKTRPFKCDECKKGFKFKSHLKEHKIWHYAPTLDCPECTTTFHRVSDQNKHLRFIHHIKP